MKRKIIQISTQLIRDNLSSLAVNALADDGSLWVTTLWKGYDPEDKENPQLQFFMSPWIEIEGIPQEGAPSMPVWEEKK